jgi:hypothetical protein
MSNSKLLVTFPASAKTADVCLRLLKQRTNINVSSTFLIDGASYLVEVASPFYAVTINGAKSISELPGFDVVRELIELMVTHMTEAGFHMRGVQLVVKATCAEVKTYLDESKTFSKEKGVGVNVDPEHPDMCMLRLWYSRIKINDLTFTWDNVNIAPHQFTKHACFVSLRRLNPETGAQEMFLVKHFTPSCEAEANYGDVGGNQEPFHGQDTWERMDESKDESKEETIISEAKEESGYGQLENLRLVHSIEKDGKKALYFFVAEIKSGLEADVDNYEVAEGMWIPLDGTTHDAEKKTLTLASGKTIAVQGFVKRTFDK